MSANTANAIVLALVREEMGRAGVKFGPQTDLPDKPDGAGAADLIGLHSGEAKRLTDRAAEVGKLTWADVLGEEVAEAFDASNETELAAELVQVAAVALRWVKAIHERQRAPQWDPLVEMSDGSTRPLSMVDVDEGPTGDGWDL